MEFLMELALYLTKSLKKIKEPGTCRLIRTASKAFAAGTGGDEKSGCQGPFRTYVQDFLKKHNMVTVPIKTYRGNRFNILFENASTLYFLHDQMETFLENYAAKSRLLKAVLHDLHIKEYIAGVKALGLISRLITCPLWCILEDKDINILDMNTKYLELTTFLTEAGMNTDEFMKGMNSPFDEYVKKDCIYQALL